MTTHELAQELLKYPDKEVKIQYHDLLSWRNRFLRILNIRNFSNVVSIDVSEEMEDIEYNGEKLEIE